MTNTEKIAKVFGYIKPYPSPLLFETMPDGSPDQRTAQTEKCFGAWLSSAEGQIAIQEKVREMWCKNNIHHHWKVQGQGVGDGVVTVTLWNQVRDLDGRHFIADTSAEAWQAALLWLLQAALEGK